jgi:hypothetical protein
VTSAVPRTGKKPLRGRRSNAPHALNRVCAPTSDILLAVNGEASLHRGNPARCRSISGLTLPRSAGRVSTLARERPVALPRGLPSATESLPRGFSTRLSPWRSCLAAHPPARFTPSRGQPITRASRAPQTWVECGPTPAACRRRESAEPVCELSARAILSVGVPARQSPVVCGPERTRFTPAVNGGILSLKDDREDHTSRIASATYYHP